MEAGVRELAVSVEQRLRDLGIDLPAAPPPPGHYVAAYTRGDVAETAGHLPFEDGVIAIRGRLGAELDIDAGASAAKLATLNALASLRAAIGTLDRVQRVITVRGYVSATPDFDQHHLVTNGTSDLILSIFGAEAGGHIRASVGVASLPFGAPVEIELSAVIRPAKA
jgi:enamine deaminase RidA (YjgF/YER057c/UK114 family)